MSLFENARTQQIGWVNEHGTHKKSGVTRILPVASAGDSLSRWRRMGAVMQEVVSYAFTKNEPLRPDGSRWSLSKVGMPSKLALSLAAHDVLEQVPGAWLSSSYSNDLDGRGKKPMLISGSMKIGRINRSLAMRDLALQTSGASDGQTLAGASTTGTHGAAIRLGAIHDTFSAVHVMVGPQRALLIQPSSKPLKKSAASSLTSWLGFPTELVSDDDLFEAVIVGLGSMGIVLNVVVEVEPLYFLTSITTPHTDDKWWDVLTKMNAAGIPGHPRGPWHLEVLTTPYDQKPKSAPRAWVKTMVKTPFAHHRSVETDPSHPPRPNSDLINLIAGAAEFFDCGMSNSAFRSAITQQMVDRYGTSKSTRKAIPGVMFGPTELPRGRGDSIEFAVDGKNAKAAMETLFAALNSELNKGRQFLGGVGIRFVGGSRATLAPNAKSPTCFIELPGIRTKESEKIYDACGGALEEAGINFGCHWGQYLTGTKKSLQTYWTEEQRDAWVAARKKILPTPEARAIFASPILGPAGLGD